MTGPDDEFDEFLSRRRPLFRRTGDEGIEPPNEVDRLVLRQARDAIKPPQPERMYRGPGWGVPLAVAATLLVCLSMVLHVMMPKKAAAPGEATQQVAQRVDAAPVTAPAGVSAERQDQVANNSPPAPVADPAAAQADAGARVAGAADTPWRGDARSWLAEIERLRNAGKTAEADAELALYKRQHRAYASSPDR
jgi:hypothetical protein